MQYNPLIMKHGRYEGSITSFASSSYGTPGIIASELESVLTWANNADGQLGIGSEVEFEPVPFRFKSGGVLKVVGGGEYQSAATGFLQMDCEANFTYMYAGLILVGLGDNTYQVICEEKNNPAFCSGEILSEYYLVSAGCMGEHAAVIKSDGSLMIWGRNNYNQCSVGGEIIALNEFIHEGAWDFVSAGRDFTIGIKQDGTMWGIGRNDTGQLGMSSPTKVLDFTQIGLKDDWVFVSCGSNHSIALDSIGRLYVTGLNDNGQLGLGHFITRTEFVQLGSVLWRTVSAGHNFSIGCDIENNVRGWGSNSNGQLGIGVTGGNYQTPTDSIIENWYTTHDDQRTIKKVACGGYHSIITTEYEDIAGTSASPVFVCGRNAENQLGMGEGTVGGTELNVFRFPTELQGLQGSVDAHMETWYWVDCGAYHTALTSWRQSGLSISQRLTGDNRRIQCTTSDTGAGEQYQFTTRGDWVYAMALGARYYSIGLGLNFSMFLRSGGT